MDGTVSEADIIALTGYRQPAAQLRALHAQGFTRARRNAAGRVVLEGPHYRAVCAGRADVERVPELLPA